MFFRSGCEDSKKILPVYWIHGTEFTFLLLHKISFCNRNGIGYFQLSEAEVRV
jgi:hypothetical protein